MKPYTLRNHIPLGGPATREPCTGSEEHIRVSLGFTPAWYQDRLGIDFSESWHIDPHYRYEALISMKTMLHDLFPNVPYFVPSISDEGFDPLCATISGVYGIMLLPAIYGIDILYRSDQWPDAANEVYISKEEIIALPPFTDRYLKGLPIVQELFRQIDVLEKRWGMVHGYLNYQSTINVAVKVMGSAFLMEMIDDSEFTHTFLAHIAHTICTIAQMVQARQRESGFDINLISMSNCTVNMISPQLYVEQILPLDDMISRKFKRFGIHTCNWVIDKYLDAMSKIERIGYIDTGMNSDLIRVKKTFPNARRAVLYTPGELECKTLDEIHSDIERLSKEYAPCDLVLADIETTTPEKRVREVLDFAKALSRTVNSGV